MGGKGAVIVLEQSLVKSKVWLSLTGAAPQVYLLFRTKCRFVKRQGKPGKREMIIANNGELEFTYDDAKGEYGITRSRFTRALDQLIDRGFIDVAATGMGVHRVKSWYAISERWRDYGTPDFQPATRPKPSIANPGFKKGNELWMKARKRISSAKDQHGAVRKNEHGAIFTMRTDAHGQKIAILYKFTGDGWLPCRIA